MIPHEIGNYFEDFIVGPSNQFAHAASVAAAKEPGTYQMKLSYQRPWEKANGTRECNIKIIVKN